MRANCPSSAVRSQSRAFPSHTQQKQRLPTSASKPAWVALSSFQAAAVASARVHACSNQHPTQPHTIARIRLEIT